MIEKQKKMLAQVTELAADARDLIESGVKLNSVYAGLTAARDGLAARLRALDVSAPAKPAKPAKKSTATATTA